MAMDCMSVPEPAFERPVRIPANVQVQFARPRVIRAGEACCCSVPFIVAEDVPQDAPVHILIQAGRHVKGAWRGVKTEPAGAEGVTVLRRMGGEVIEGLQSRNGPVLEFRAPGGGLRAGERLELQLCGTAPTLTYPNKMFLLAVPAPKTPPPLGTPAVNVDPGWRTIGACLIHVIGAGIDHLRVYAPSQVTAGETFSLFIRPEDRWDNVASERPGRLEVRAGDVLLQGWRRCDASDSACLRVEGLHLDEPGVYRITVREPDQDRVARSNPIIVRSDAGAESAAGPVQRNVFWGMIHGHTEHSDGYGSVHHYFRYARDRAALDFAALGDHDHVWETSDEMWLRTQEATAAFNDPPRFVTFLGYEWAKWRRNGDGDRNVYYLHDYRPMYRSDLGHRPTPADLFRALENETAIIIPHHPAEIGNHCDWKDHDPLHERLVEIYSEWGSSECSVHDGNPFPVRPAAVPGVKRDGVDAGEVREGFVQRALELGWRVGFTAGGDDHTGHPGAEIWKGAAPWRYKPGILAVLATDNTREGIWDALWNRRCYGTTGARMLVDVRIGGAVPGAELRIADCPDLARERTVEATVYGTGPIERVDVLRNNRVVYSHTGNGEDVHFVWTDSKPFEDAALPPAKFCPHPFCFYYVRVRQVDGETAWISPVWIEP